MYTVMTLSAGRLRREGDEAGTANAAINAVWPEWWSAEAEASLSATAELTYTVARRLGLSPAPYLTDRRSSYGTIAPNLKTSVLQLIGIRPSWRPLAQP